MQQFHHLPFTVKLLVLVEKTILEIRCSVGLKIDEVIVDESLHFNNDSFFIAIIIFFHPPPLPRDLEEYPPRPPQYCCCWYCSFDMAFLISHYKKDNTIFVLIDALVVRYITVSKQSAITKE